MRSMLRKRKEGSSDHSDTCQSLPRALPAQVPQIKVKQNHQNITTIPVVSDCHNIKHLYLSHNRISSLQGIQHYPSLVSLNVSYNCLTKISELNLIAHPQNINKINLRMNQFQFGYQDYAVKLLSNLKKLEDKDLPDKEMKQKLSKMKDLIGKQFLEFYKRTNLIVREMSEHQDKQNRNSNENNKGKTKRNKGSEISTQNLDNLFFSRLKDLYFYPKIESLQQKNIIFLTKICFDYIQIVKATEIQTCQKAHLLQDNYLNETREAFNEVCRSFLLKFSSRNDKTLKQYIDSLCSQGISITEGFAKLGKFESHVKDSIQLFGEGVRVPSIDVNPARYMERLKNKELLEHPMNRLANWKKPDYRTLIPFEQTKWHQFYQSHQEPIQHLFEQVPVFLYCKEYLQVLAEIVLDQIGKILAIEHTIISAAASSKDRDQSQEVELNLSSSQIMSFGQKDNAQLDDSLDRQTFKKIEYPQKQLSDRIQLGQELSPQREGLLNTNQQRIQPNLDKYTIYQINLIFKTFRTLKLRSKLKRQRQ